MKLNVKSVKNVTPNKNMIKKVIAVVLSIAVIVGSYIAINKAAEDTRNTVAVVRVKNNDGLEMNTLITENDVETYNIIRTEYTEDMVLAEDIENVIDTYTMYYLRKNSIVYKDQVGGERPITNEWLYNLVEDEEVVTIQYNYLKCGGDILMPGDRVRIRATYDITNEASTNSSWYGDSSDAIEYSDKNNTKRTQIIFDSIEIMDMLNEDSHSIYEIYKEILRMDEKQRQQVMRSEDFIKSILPRALVLAGTKDQINEYAKYANVKDGDLLITILSRENSNPIIDQLPTLQSEVESWIETSEN